MQGVKVAESRNARDIIDSLQKSEVVLHELSCRSSWSLSIQGPSQQSPLGNKIGVGDESRAGLTCHMQLHSGLVLLQICIGNILVTYLCRLCRTAYCSRTLLNAMSIKILYFKKNV